VRTTYNKLVRDRIPEIIKLEGRDPVTRILNDEEYRSSLLAKLREEAQEAESASAENLLCELADILEVLLALTETHNITWREVESAATLKRAQRGGFRGRVFLEYVEHTD